MTARLEGRDLGSGMRDVKSTVDGLHLPASVRVDYGGLYAEQQKSLADLSLVFAAAPGESPPGHDCDTCRRAAAVD